MDLIVPIIRELTDRLENNLAAEITAINAEAETEYDLEVPISVLDYPPVPELLVDFPTISVSDGTGKFEDDTGHSATGRHLALICAYVQDADQRALAWRLRDYSRAIARVALDGRNLGTAAWGTGLEGVYPGPAFADSEDPESVTSWMSWVGVRIWAKRDED